LVKAANRYFRTVAKHPTRKAIGRNVTRPPQSTKIVVPGMAWYTTATALVTNSGAVPHLLIFEIVLGHAHGSPA
jgi:hypothetical protein